MSPLYHLIYFFLPFLVSSIIVNINPLTLNNATFIHQSYYMSKKQSTSSNSNNENGKSYIQLNLEIDKADERRKGNGIIEALIVPESAYNQIGYYTDNRRHVVCCDAEAMKEKHCSNPYHLILNGIDPKKMIYSELVYSGQKMSRSLSYTIQSEGKYYIVIGACSPETRNLQIKGDSQSVNYFGHIPARMYGMIGFSKVFVGVYVGLCIIWLSRVFMYLKELMSIHVLITVVLLVFTFSSILTLFNLTLLNYEGTYQPLILALNHLVSSLSRTLLRCLLLLISKGLGISIASLGSSFWGVLFLCIAYFLNSIAYEFTNSQITVIYEGDMQNNIFMIPAIVLDVILYIWIVKSLFSTIDDLREKNQTSKLEVFITLRHVLIFLVLGTTLYNILFSYLVSEQIIESIWKVQWLLTDGVWTVLYTLIIVIIMYLWAPNDRSVAYAFHHQIATDEKVDMEEYAMPEVELQTTGGKVEVTSVDDSALKPMKM